MQLLQTLAAAKLSLLLQTWLYMTRLHTRFVADVSSSRAAKSFTFDEEKVLKLLFYFTRNHGPTDTV